MLKMIFYKEWLKTRWFILGIGAVLLGGMLYVALSLSKTAQFNGADTLWSLLLMKDTVLIETLKYLPLASGAILAAAQFLPEASRSRLKLTLHLPYPQGKMIAMMYGYGLIVLAILWGLQLIAVSAVVGHFVVKELLWRVIATAAVWYLAGFAAYIWVSAICLEPSWGMKVVLGLTLAAFGRLLFISAIPESYNGFLPWLCIYTALGVLLIHHSVYRFKEGLQ